MPKYEFVSPFKDEIQKYIQMRTDAGYSEKNLMSQLKKFDQFCVHEGITEPIFTKNNALHWIEKQNDEYQTSHYSRVNFSKHFLTYLFLKGYEVYVVRDIKYLGTEFQPYIYTDGDTDGYFMAVDNFSSTQNRKTALQYPVLFRILYCCGTRITETLRIRKKDVDLNKGIIMLSETKNNKHRYVVVGDDLLELLRDYANRCFYLMGDDDYIFTNRNGYSLNKKTVYEHHRQFLHAANIPYRGEGYGPRIHDWRHHMAVYSFKQLADQGMDMYVALPIVSTYLGHETIFATERYVRLTLQVFPHIEEKFKPVMDRIFGGFEHEDN